MGDRPRPPLGETLNKVVGLGDKTGDRGGMEIVIVVGEPEFLSRGEEPGWLGETESRFPELAD
jgi:hypothetical protein